MMVFILFFASLLLLLIVGFNVATILTTEAAILDQVNDDRSVSMKRGNLQSNVWLRNEFLPCDAATLARS